MKIGALRPEVTSLIGTSNQLTVATFNVENLDPKKEDIAKVTGRSSSKVDDDIADGRFTAIAQQIINNLKAPDIVALQEIQDSDGAEISAVVDAKLTVQTLIDAIVSAGGPRYEYRDLAPVYGQDGGQPGGNIRPGFLFNPDRVNFREGSLLRLTDNNLLDGDAFANSRKPLVGEFIFNGQTVTRQQPFQLQRRRPSPLRREPTAHSHQQNSTLTASDDRQPIRHWIAQSKQQQQRHGGWRFKRFPILQTLKNACR